MNIPRKYTAVVGPILVAALGLSATPSAATTMTCGERGSSLRLVTNADKVLTISVSQSDGITWQALNSSTKVRIDYGDGFSKAKSTGWFRVPKNLKTFKIKAKGKSGQIYVSCSNKTDQPTYDNAQGIAANSQTLATNTGIGTNAEQRFGAGGNIVSKNKVYVSTSNMPQNQAGRRFLPPDWSLWGTLEGRSYTGGIAGHSVDFVGGMDKLVTPDLLLGVLAGFGRTSVTDIGTPEIVNSPMLGVYFSKKSDRTLIMNGFISYARPQYDIFGAAFTSTRSSAGLSLSGQFARPGVTLEPFLRARGYQEFQPGYTTALGAVVARNQIAAFSASLGVKVNFTGTNQRRGLVPYVSAAADYRYTISTSGTRDVLISPRIALGLKGKLGAGEMTIDLDFGKTRSDTYDRGIKFGYELKF